MKKNIWITAGIAGMLLGIPSSNVKAAVNININTGSRPSFIINSPPSFVYLRTQGFSVSVGSPYDIVYYGNRYYIFYEGHWYRSYYYRGPWVLILDNRIPYQIRRHRWDDIRRYRDIEYRRSDSRNNQHQRNDDNKRRILDIRSDATNRKIQAQQNRGTVTRQNQGQQIRGQAKQQMQGQQNRGPANQQNQGQQSRGPAKQQMQGQQNRGPANQQNQGQQIRGQANQQMQGQQNRGPAKQQNQRQQNQGSGHQQNQGQGQKGERGK